VLLMLIFGAVFSTEGEYSVTLYVQDLDQTPMSANFTQSLSEAFTVEEMPSDVSAVQYAKEHNIKAALVIPKGFQSQIANASAGRVENITLTLILDPTVESRASVVRSIVAGVVEGWNTKLLHKQNVLLYREESVVSEEFKYIDFFMPGVIGMSVMTVSIYGTLFRNTKYREMGILRKLATTPLKRSEWILSKMLFMTFISFVSTASILIVGIGVFHVQVFINCYMLIIIVSASFVFAGMAMIISRFVKEEESADTAAGAITFPMMFLTGTFFPLEMMPSYLAKIAKFLPLYYVNEGLRAAMIYGKWEDAMHNTLVILITAAVFFAVGVCLTRWREE